MNELQRCNNEFYALAADGKQAKIEAQKSASESEVTRTAYGPPDRLRRETYNESGQEYREARKLKSDGRRARRERIVETREARQEVRAAHYPFPTHSKLGYVFSFALLHFTQTESRQEQHTAGVLRGQIVA